MTGKIFSGLTVLMAACTGMAIGWLLSQRFLDDGLYDWYTPGATPGDPMIHLVMAWCAGSLGKGYTTLLTLWLAFGAFIKKVKWKWAILGAGVWWILYGALGTAMHSLS